MGERKMCHDSSRIVHTIYTSRELCQTKIYGREKDVSQGDVTSHDLMLRGPVTNCTHNTYESRTMLHTNIWASQRRPKWIVRDSRKTATILNICTYESRTTLDNDICAKETYVSRTMRTSRKTATILNIYIYTSHELDWTITYVQEKKMSHEPCEIVGKQRQQQICLYIRVTNYIEKYYIAGGKDDSRTVQETRKTAITTHICELCWIISYEREKKTFICERIFKATFIWSRISSDIHVFKYLYWHFILSCIYSDIHLFTYLYWHSFVQIFIAAFICSNIHTNIFHVFKPTSVCSRIYSNINLFALYYRSR